MSHPSKTETRTHEDNKFSMHDIRYPLWVLLLIILVLPALAHSSEVNETDNFSIYLPIVSKPLTGMHGKVTWAGKPAEGVDLKLRFYDGTAWRTLSTTLTKIDGTFAFENVPSLEKDQLYYVRYDNPNNDSLRLSLWLTPAIATYQTGSYFNFGEFDIGGILLNIPADGAYVNLPCRFTWNNFQFRPNNNNSYEFNIYYWKTGNPYFYTNVGAAREYSMNSFPEGFTYNVWYEWNIWVYDSIGGFGISYDSSVVYFTTPGIHPCTFLQSDANVKESAIVKDHPALLLGDVTQR